MAEASAPGAAAAAAVSSVPMDGGVTGGTVDEGVALRAPAAAGPQFEGREVPGDSNTPEQLDRHEEAISGRPRLRFPPEPNGYLHIGHAKSMRLNFGEATRRGGDCYLRYDDTNPAGETHEYIERIQEAVEWLGHRPFKVTFASDYFEELHRMAVELIDKGLAYVDEEESAVMKRRRRAGEPSPYRDRPMEENRRRFLDMTKGKVVEGEAVLRLRMEDPAHENPNMRDCVAYRVRFLPHPRTGDRWCVYPTYDFTHCVVDSLEEIDFSLCTLEFETRRESYYWLLDALGLYKPRVWEFARLNVAGAVLSKRRMNDLVRRGVVEGYDDPRLMTIMGMRRRGYTPEAINDFCEAKSPSVVLFGGVVAGGQKVGVSRAESVISERLLHHCVRTHLDSACDRCFIVLRPLLLTIVNWPEGEGARKYDRPVHPQREDRGRREVWMTPQIHIEETDFRLQDSRDYYGLAPGKWVGLKYGPNVRCVDVVHGDGGDVLEVRAEVDFEKRERVRTHIHWLPFTGASAGVHVEARVYEPLYLSDEDLATDSQNPSSKVVVASALAEPLVARASAGTRFQCERLGYFVVDTLRTADGLGVLNRVVSLKEADWEGKGKPGAKPAPKPKAKPRREKKKKKGTAEPPPAPDPAPADPPVTEAPTAASDEPPAE